MAVPKRKTSVSRKKMRRSHHKLTVHLILLKIKKVVNINYHITLI